MAFTGTATVKKLGDNCFRITGVSLAAGAVGQIGFSDRAGAAEIALLAPDWQPYAVVQDRTRRDANGDWVTESGGQRAEPYRVTLVDQVQVTVRAVGAGVSIVPPVSLTKTGASHADFQIEIRNLDVLPIGPLEIYVSRHI